MWLRGAVDLYGQLLCSPVSSLLSCRDQFQEVSNVSQAKLSRWRYLEGSSPLTTSSGVAPHQVARKHEQGLYTLWSLFESDLRSLLLPLSCALHSHLESRELSADSLLPLLVSLEHELTEFMPLPDDERRNYLGATEDEFLQRVQERQLRKQQWAMECPAAVGRVCAAAMLIIQQVR